nr:MAG TPA: hypothetical protein [Caudoviricetes sp.]
MGETSPPVKLCRAMRMGPRKKVEVAGEAGLSEEDLQGLSRSPLKKAASRDVEGAWGIGADAGNQCLLYRSCLCLCVLGHGP